MIYTLADFVNLDLAKFPSGDRQDQCKKCANDLRENVTGYRCPNFGPFCSDCYFDDLSSVLEQHPVGLPGVRR